MFTKEVEPNSCGSQDRSTKIDMSVAVKKLAMISSVKYVVKQNISPDGSSSIAR